jgi:hypothetical protein
LQLQDNFRFEIPFGEMSVPFMPIKQHYAHRRRPVMPVFPQKMPGRIVIYAKDVENITGRKQRASRKLLQNIREKYGKQPGDFVTVREFCLHTGIAEDEVRDFLLD